MPDVALLEPARAYGRFKPRTFVRALLDGCTLAEAARRGGSECQDEAARHHVGWRWTKHPKVQAMLRDINPTVFLGVAGGVKWMSEAACGLVKVSDQDRVDIVNTLGRLAGLFVTRLEVSGEVLVKIKGFPTLHATPAPLDASLVQPASLPALPASTASMTDAELLAELARRGLSPAALVPAVKPAT